MTFTKYCPFLINNYFSAQDIEFQFSTLLLLDIARYKVLSKSSRKLKIEILLWNRKGDQSAQCLSCRGVGGVEPPQLFFQPPQLMSVPRAWGVSRNPPSSS